MHSFKFRAILWHPVILKAENLMVNLHYENKYTENFSAKKKKKKKKSDKKFDILHISAQNIDCGYSLKPPRRGGFNTYHNLCVWAEIRKVMYTPVNLGFII